ncbi:queuosine precursor transporter [Tundrisphaera sp. TA3]|uniref:queuosine precursor transporter n=1 Tax=Tundrisphaera sp. TA3 TaxID=3435775 RepID=UPI003EBFAD14
MATDVSWDEPGAVAKGPRTYRYYDFLMAAFVTILICSNFISVPKRVTVGPLTFGAGVLFFPISYLFGDILTEVYGYARSRKVVWAGFTALVFASFMSWVVLMLPPDPRWPNQKAYEAIFGNAPRVVLASISAFFVGEFVNSYVMAKVKVRTQGRFLWVRTIGSTIVGEAADSLIFYPIAFLGVWPNDRLIQVLITNYTLKVTWEVLATPLTYFVVNALKRAESEDHYDIDTDFTPFSLQT